MNILDIAPERFTAIYNSLDPVEQETLTQILKEFSETGESETYKNVWLQDYEEIPVDIDTFLENNEYLFCESKSAKRYKSPFVLTEKGNEAGKRIADKINSVLDEVSVGLTDEERIQFYKSLAILKKRWYNRYRNR